jgi:hypothetical protein
MSVAEFYYLEGGLFFGFLVAVALAAGLPRPDHRIAKRCAWAAAILFGSIAVVWGVTTTESAWIRIPAVGIAGLLAAICLTEALRFIKDRELPVKPDSPEARAPAQTTRQPTLEATDRSKIDASGAKFTGDLGFPFARADSDSVIDMANITVTTNKDTGVTTVTPGNTARVFPPPSGEFMNFSSAELATTVHDFTSKLRTFQDDFDQNFYEPNRKWPADEKANAVLSKYSALYEGQFSKEALSLAAELLSRIGSVQSASISHQAQMGSTVVLHGKLVGPDPAISAAEFLEALSDKLSSN